MSFEFPARLPEVTKSSRNLAPAEISDGVSGQLRGTSTTSWAEAVPVGGRRAAGRASASRSRHPATRRSSAAKPACANAAGRRRREPAERRSSCAGRARRERSEDGHRRPVDGRGIRHPGNHVRSQGRSLGSRLSVLGSRLSVLGSRLSVLGSRLSALGSRLSALGSHSFSVHGIVARINRKHQTTHCFCFLFQFAELYLRVGTVHDEHSNRLSSLSQPTPTLMPKPQLRQCPERPQGRRPLRRRRPSPLIFPPHRRPAAPRRPPGSRPPGRGPSGARHSAAGGRRRGRNGRS